MKKILKSIKNLFKSNYNLGKSTPLPSHNRGIDNSPEAKENEAKELFLMAKTQSKNLHEEKWECRNKGLHKKTEEVGKLKTPKIPPYRLTDRERLVLALILAGYNVDNIAKHMVVTRERIRQIYAKIGRKIQRS